MFNPIRIEMRHSKVPSAAARTLRSQSRSSVRRMSTPTGGLGGHGERMRGEELIFKVGASTF